MVNQTTLSGVVKEQPEVRVSQNGNSYCTFDLHIQVKDRGEWVEKPIPILCFGESAQLFQNFAGPMPVLVFARTGLDEWEHKGKAYSKVTMTAFDVLPVSLPEGGSDTDDYYGAV